MKLKKLSLEDFEAVDNVELLELKGGYGGPGGVNGCPKCKEAYENEGTPIPRRCNGSSHFSGSSQNGAIATGLSSASQALGPGGISGYTTGMAFLSGYISGSFEQAWDYYSTTYYSGSSSQPTCAPSRAEIITGS